MPSAARTAVDIGALAVCVGCAVPETQSIELGAPAPSYGAVTLAGDSTSLNGLRGQVVLLNVWATWCHPCREEIPYLESLHTRYYPAGLRIVGVSIDAANDRESIASFGREYGMTYAVWHDPEDRVSMTYQALGVPATYLIDRMGVLRWRRVGQLRPGDRAFIRAMEAAIGTSTESPDGKARGDSLPPR